MRRPSDDLDDLRPFDPHQKLELVPQALEALRGHVVPDPGRKRRRLVGSLVVALARGNDVVAHDGADYRPRIGTLQGRAADPAPPVQIPP
jgi:hypothetical protein